MDLFFCLWWCCFFIYLFKKKEEGEKKRKKARVHVFDGAFGWWLQLLFAAFPLLCGGLRGTLWKMLFPSSFHMVASNWALVS